MLVIVDLSVSSEISRGTPVKDILGLPSCMSSYNLTGG
jgi:hypothetical protein